MFQTFRRKAVRLVTQLAPLGMAAALVPLPGTTVAPSGRMTPFKEAKIFIEYNATDQDVGIQFKLDGEGWKSMMVLDPGNVEIFSADGEGSMFDQGGATEMFLESVEPSTEDLSLHDFFQRFREGRYRFNGRAPDGHRFGRSAQLSHVIPAKPIVLEPASSDDCESNLLTGGVISWEPVTLDIRGNPVQIKGYEVIIESEDEGEPEGEGDALDVKVGEFVNQLTIPVEFLDHDEDYPFEVLAIAENGNQTITGGCFHTLP